MAKFRSSVGLQRIGKNVSSSQASYTRDVRAAMDNIIKNYEAVISDIKGATNAVLKEALTPTFEKAKEYTPKDTEALVNSGYLEVKGRGANAKAEIGFGKGGKPFYAVYVHERTDLHHASPTRAKFLQGALEEDLPKLLPRLKDAYGRRVKIQ